MIETLLKCCAAAILCAVCGLLVKKSNPEYSSLLAAASVCAILLVCAELSAQIKKVFETLEIYFNAGREGIAPLLKCTLIACITRFSSDICRDSAQTAAASALELTGTVCAAAVSAPLIITILKTIGEMI